MSTTVAPQTRRSMAAAQPLVFAAIGVGFGLLLIGGTETLYRVQGGASDVAGLLPFGYAYAAGMVAAVNPCGVLLLPSLVAYYLGGDDVPRHTTWGRAARAALLGAMATAGFVALFASVGFVFAASGRALGALFPLGGLAVGIALTSLGLWMVMTGRSVGLASASRAMGGVRLQADVRSMFLFGVGYGVASLACTLPVFLVVVGTTLAATGIVQATAQFVMFALGMGTLITVVIVGAAFVRSAVTRSLRATLPYLHRLAASLLLGAGIFLIHYWLQ